MLSSSLCPTGREMLIDLLLRQPTRRLSMMKRMKFLIEKFWICGFRKTSFHMWLGTLMFFLEEEQFWEMDDEEG